jgi:hypothetical protein
VKGYNFVPGSDNISGTFDDHPVSFTPSDVQYQGSTGGTLAADATGFTSGTFTIPSGVPTGTRVLKLISVGNNDASASFTGRSVLNTTEIRNHTHTIFRQQWVWEPGVDPVAQSFLLPESQFVTAVGVFFTAKDMTGSHNVVVQIRNTENGYPGKEIYARKILTPAAITATANGSTETKVVLDDPIFLEGGVEYSVCLLTDSAVYSVATATMDKIDLVTGQRVKAQPYLIGTMFSSANGSAWTPHQSSDMKFKIYSAVFQTTGQADFSVIDVSAQKPDRFTLNSLTFAPEGTRVDWEVSVNGGSFTAISPVINRPLPELADTIVVRAKLKGTRKVTPAIFAPSLSLSTFKNLSDGVYVSRNVVTPQTYTTVKQIAEIAVPSGTTVEVQFSHDNGATWVTQSSPTIVQVDQEFSQYTFTATGLTPAKNNFRARLNLSRSNEKLRPRVRKFMNVMK